MLWRTLTAPAARAPEAEALRAGARRWSFGALARDAGRLAAGLAAEGVGRGDRVALFLDRSPEGIIAIYGALMVGAAYVPLDPQAPPARNAAILAASGARALISIDPLRRRLRPLLKVAGGALPRFNLSGGPAPGGDAALRADDLPPPAAPAPGDPEDLAYVLYTSGSTGRPKGVALSHRAALAFSGWAIDAFGLGPGDRVSGVSPLQFDLSTFEVFAALGAGACACVAPGGATAFPKTLADYLADEGVTVWYSVPGVLARLMAAGLEDRAFPRLRAVLFAGEVFPPAPLRRLVAALPGVTFANLYGPTETNVCTFHVLGDAPEEDLPIGVAASGASLRIEGPGGEQVADGEAGELLVAGPSLLSGYLGDPAATAAALVERGGRTFYRTGDRVRLDAAGRLRFMGRVDSMLKIDGWRVQPEEIEAALASHPAVAEALVTLEAGGLRARVVGSPVAARELLLHCGRRVPRYMVPARVEWLDALPRTARGKLDRGASGS